MVSAHMTRAEVGAAGSMYHRRPPSIIAFAIGDVAFWPHIGDAGFCIDIKKHDYKIEQEFLYHILKKKRRI